MPNLVTMKGGFEDIVLYILGAIVLIIFGGCIYAFFRAVFLFIFSDGKTEKKQAAWSSIRYMLIGLFLSIMFLFAAPTTLRFMNVKGAENYTAKAVFTYAGKIVSYIFSLGNIIKESQDSNKANANLYYPGI